MSTREITNGKVRMVFFSEARIELSKEVANHPKLLDKLTAVNSQDFDDRLAVIAAYCNIALDDIYTQKDIDSICELCIARLKNKQVILIPQLQAV